MAIGAAHLGAFTAAQAKGAPRELAALVSVSEWINTPRLTVEHLTGKVVVVDFCTYTCINWLRTLPHGLAACPRTVSTTSRSCVTPRTAIRP